MHVLQKEDVENALRTTNMSVQDAFEILTASSRMPEAWNRRQDEHSFDHSGAPFSRGFNPGQQVSFPPVSTIAQNSGKTDCYCYFNIFLCIFKHRKF